AARPAAWPGRPPIPRRRARSRMRTAAYGTTRWDGSVAVDVGREGADERQVAVLLRVVQAVADDEVGRYVEAHVADVDLDLGRLGLAQHRRDLDRGRAARTQVRQQPRQRQP